MTECKITHFFHLNTINTVQVYNIKVFLNAVILVLIP